MPNAADIWNAIQRYGRFLITSHVRPDPDAIGSEIALALYLGKLGKECRIVNEGHLPRAYAFLPHSELVLAFPEGMDFGYDAVFLLDAPEMSRAGQVGSRAREAPLIIVDHHPYENAMADVAWIDSDNAATGQMLYMFMSYQRAHIDSEIATCLYAAIMTDTGRFMYANTNQRTLEAAADLVSLGADPHAIAESYYENISDGQMYLSGLVATRIKRAAGGKIAYASLFAEDFEKAGAGPEAAQDLPELPRSLDGVLVGALFRDVGGKTKASLRSKCGVDVKEIAEHFGGGGHREASGFMLDLPPAQAESVAVRYIEEHLRRNGRL